MGFFIGLEIVKDRKSREPDSQIATRIITRYRGVYDYTLNVVLVLFFRMLRTHRVIMSVDGNYNNVIKFKPPMCFNKENADYLLKCLEECFDDLKNL